MVAFLHASKLLFCRPSTLRLAQPRRLAVGHQHAARAPPMEALSEIEPSAKLRSAFSETDACVLLFWKR